MPPADHPAQDDRAQDHRAQDDRAQDHRAQDHRAHDRQAQDHPAQSRTPRRRPATTSAQRRARTQARIERRRASLPAITYPPELPVTQHHDELLTAIRDHQVVVVAGETGSGKTTQLPKICLELGRGITGTIAHTQPRRLAARTVAQRIADELRTPLGKAVGYAVRFDDRGSEDTLIRLVTDGLLLAEIRRDPLLRRYDTVIVDEAHERSLNIDFLLGCLHRILPQRPDLKLIITSATIDPERFSKHFGDAPIVEVSGRTYPVEVRYRPPEPEQEPLDALADAVEELLTERDGDVLAFFSGEREIRDAAELLAGRLPDGVEVLPLYSRLATADQQKVFSRTTKLRRVVLATNVAETSVTVPGIRFVVDTGLARISRYSTRLKVQRLPIEPISQASANQRAGRCGRLADGICVRLYSEQDFEARPRFTDPEILRTNLASVILQMAALKLGEIEAFPFLEPPDRRQIRDGIALLDELQALDHEKRLTPIGRKLARLPIDPRLGRMVIEADARACTNEVIVIAAALSIQDPRERPAEHRAQADHLHARFADKSSDFISYVNLWEHLQTTADELSRSQFRKRCKAEFLHYMRIREWQDLVAQLTDAADEVGLDFNQTPAEPPQIHTALLSGLLSHIGLKDANSREFTGARGASFAIFPGSALARRPPSWVMVAELVETSRLWGRTAAAVDPRQIEPLAQHLVKRSYGEPRWDRRGASVVASENVTLYGLPIVTARTVQYGRIDAEAARAIFIQNALVEGDWEEHHAFMRENERRIAEVEALEARARRRDLLADEQQRAAFFDERIPPGIVGGRHFDRWWKRVKQTDPDLLDYPMELLIAGDYAIDDPGRPPFWRQGQLDMPLSYRFDPGTAHDGVTAHIPLDALGDVRDLNFEWLVPAFRAELYEALLRMLPKPLRKALVPIPDTAAMLLADVTPRSGPMLTVLAEAVERLRGVRIAPGDWSLDKLPPHLRMSFSIEDADGAVLASGVQLDELRERLRPLLKARLQEAMPSLARTGMRAFDVESLPRTVSLAGGLRGYPALVDEGQAVGIRVFETAGEQARAMELGTRRLLRLTVPSPRNWVLGQLDPRLTLTLAAAPHGSLDAVLDDAWDAAVDALVISCGGPAWTATAFTALREHVRGSVRPATLDAVRALARVVAAERSVVAQLDALPANAVLAPAREDGARQLGRLVYPGMLAATGVSRLPDVERYLQAAAQRLEKLPGRIGADHDRMVSIQQLEAAAGGRPDVQWLIEELRVAQLAPGPHVRPGATVKRVREALAGR